MVDIELDTAVEWIDAAYVDADETFADDERRNDLLAAFENCGEYFVVERVSRTDLSERAGDSVVDTTYSED